ncbi:transposase [Sphingobium sp. 22B]|uniref:transposase n=1 Tax=Sphingobium sp. 22B TaxID=936474 RepID=UPI0012903DE6|nr:transposase [Sphingobium sp. 22B]
MSQMTVISGPERRRVWTDQQKRELVAAVSAPGANVAEIARRADLRPNQIYRWRRQMEQAAQGFAEVAALCGAWDYVESWAARHGPPTNREDITQHNLDGGPPSAWR